jgi:hypothetical protein
MAIHSEASGKAAGFIGQQEMCVSKWHCSDSLGPAIDTQCGYFYEPTKIGDRSPHKRLWSYGAAVWKGSGRKRMMKRLKSPCTAPSTILYALGPGATGLLRRSQVPPNANGWERIDGWGRRGAFKLRRTARRPNFGQSRLLLICKCIPSVSICQIHQVPLANLKWI